MKLGGVHGDSLTGEGTFQGEAKDNKKSIRILRQKFQGKKEH